MFGLDYARSARDSPTLQKFTNYRTSCVRLGRHLRSLIKLLKVTGQQCGFYKALKLKRCNDSRQKPE